MGPCASQPKNDPTPTAFAVVYDRLCVEDYAYDDQLDKLGEGAQV